MSRIGTIMFLGLAQAGEKYIDGLKGFSDNLGGSVSEIQECISEILMEQSEYLEELTSPYARLGLVVGMAGLQTYVTNTRSGGTVMVDTPSVKCEPVLQKNNTSEAEKTLNAEVFDMIKAPDSVVKPIEKSDISAASSTAFVSVTAKPGKKTYTRTKPYRRNGKIFCHLTGKVIGTY